MTRGEHVSQSKSSVSLVSLKILAYQSIYRNKTLLLVKLCAFLTKLVHSTWLEKCWPLFSLEEVGGGGGEVGGWRKAIKQRGLISRHLDRTSLVNIDQYSDLENFSLQE